MPGDIRPATPQPLEDDTEPSTEGKISAAIKIEPSSSTSNNLNTGDSGTTAHTS